MTWYSSRVTRNWLIAVGVALAPLGCSSSTEADYKFGAAEVEQLFVGTWSGTWENDTPPDAGTSEAGADDAGTSEGGTPRAHFTLRIERVPRTGASPLCGARPLSNRPLCVSVSEMPLRATLDVDDGSFTGVEMTGMLRVPGAELDEGDLSLRATSADVAIVAQWIISKWLFCVANHATTGRILAGCTLDSRMP
jgi:hypothetical protein